MSETIYTKLLAVQKELKAPRTEKGRFGNARSAEQILALAKPVCNKHGLFIFTSDEISQVGERNYITTTASVVDQDGATHSAKASAWENDVSVGLDTSQVSGKTSSYAKKYALQNLFAIDDTTDADFEHEEVVENVKSRVSKSNVDRITELAKKLDYTDAQIKAKIASIRNDEVAEAAIDKLNTLVFQKDM